MIIVRVELHSAVDGSVRELARMYITNVGGTHTLRDYKVQTLRGRSKEQLDQAARERSYTHQGEVVKHRSLALHVWHLVGKALKRIGYVT